MARSGFEMWFRAQYGKPPDSLINARERLGSARHRHERAEECYRRVMKYYARREAALQAWQAALTK